MNLILTNSNNVETISKIDNENRRISDEDIDVGDYDRGEGKLLLICHKQEIYWRSIFKPHTHFIKVLFCMFYIVRICMFYIVLYFIFHSLYTYFNCIFKKVVFSSYIATEAFKRNK